MSDETWEPLSVRRGWKEPAPPSSRIPNHLHSEVGEWLVGRLTMHTFGGGSYPNRDLLRLLAARFGKTLERAPYGHEHEYLVEMCAGEPDMFLDFVDAVLGHTGPADDCADINELLRVSNCLWMVAPDVKALTERIEPTAQVAAELAMTPEDAASGQLREAWDNAYGVDRDASDAWDHAIKAVEAVLSTSVIPNEGEPTLGKILGQLRPNTHLYQLEVGDNWDSRRLVSMLDCLWVNPDRHEGGKGNRTPPDEEAQAVVQLASTIVQWARLGRIYRKPKS